MKGFTILRYYSKKEVDSALEQGEEIVLNDAIIQGMINGIYDNYIIREGLCGKDLRGWDLSGLTAKMLPYISFDENTIFPENLQQEAATLLESSKSIMTEIDRLHEMGITGNGTNIAIIDTPFDSTMLPSVEYHSMDNVRQENHGITVAYIISQIVPQANITFFGDNKSLKENRVSKTTEFISSVLQGQKLDVDVLSISSSLALDRSLLSERCEIINSSNFNSSELGFGYGLRRNIDGKEIIEQSDCQSEGPELTERGRRESEYLSILKRSGIDEITSETKERIFKIIDGMNITEEAKNDVKKDIGYIVGSQTPEEYRLLRLHGDKQITPGKIQKNDELVCLPSAGITIKQNSGVFKYMGTNCTSFSIPVVSSLFAMARQVNPKIELEEFCKICRETASKDNGYCEISPVNMIQRVRELSRYTQSLDEQDDGDER